MRILFSFMCLLALGLTGCSEGNGEGGSGGMAGTGGEGGTGGMAGTGGEGGSGGTVACIDNVCPCTEAGIRAAIAEGVGPFRFDCDGPTTVETEAEIVIDNDVSLDGGGNLTVEGRFEGFDSSTFAVLEGVTAELRGLGVTRADCWPEEFSDKQVGPFCDSGITNGGTLTLLNCTVSGSVGRGIYNGDGGNLTILSSTVSGNGYWGLDNDGLASVVNSTVSASAVFNEGSLALSGSTLSNDQGEALLTGGPRPDRDYATTIADTLIHGGCGIGQPLSSAGHNIESPGDTCGFGQLTDQVEVTAEQLVLGPLADNGGPTMTHALGAGSVAIDQIPEVDCLDADAQPLTTDQRGEPRPETGGTMCDVGAFELQP